MPYFDGKDYIVPGAYGRVDAEALQGVGLYAMSNIGAIGPCKRGTPNEIKIFRNSVDAKREYGEGALLKSIQLMFANGAYRVYACRAGNPTQGTLLLKDSVPATNITLTTKGYGTYVNAIEVKVEAGTTGKKITIKVPESVIYPNRTGYVYETYDNLLTAAAAVTAINAGSQVVTAVLTLEGTLANAAYAPFTGGTDDDAPTTQEVSDAIDLYLDEDDVHVMHVAGIVDAAVHALLDAHCIEAAGMRRRRIAINGGTTGETSAEVIARAAALNSERTVLCSPGIYLYDDDGIETLYAPCYLAAMVCGMVAGKDVATSVTHKAFSCNKLEKKWTTVEQEALLVGGVCIAEEAKVDGATVRRIVHGITTYVTDDTWEEITTIRIADFVTMNMEKNLEKKYIGKKCAIYTLKAMKEDVMELLQRMYSPNTPADQIITGYRSISIVADTQDPRVVYVQFECAPVYSITWIFITAKLRPMITALAA